MRFLKLQYFVSLLSYGRVKEIIDNVEGGTCLKTQTMILDLALFLLQIQTCFCSLTDFTVPDTPETRDLLSWTILEASFEIKHVFVESMRAIVITRGGEVHKLKPNGKWQGQALPANRIITGDMRLGVKFFLASNGSLYIYKITQNYNVLETYQIDVTAGINASVQMVIALRLDKKSFCFYATNHIDGRALFANGTFIPVNVEANLMSCSYLSGNKRQTHCWFFKNRTLVYSELTDDCIIIMKHFIDVTNVTFISLAYNHKELWLIQDDGKFAWRRLGIHVNLPQGSRWMKFSLHLPSPVVFVLAKPSIVLVLMKSGSIARFQGPKNTNWTAWGECRCCRNSSQSRFSYCSNPSPQLVGSNCTGIDQETRTCNSNSDRCVDAFDTNNQTRCCNMPNTVRLNSTAVLHYNSCYPLSRNVSGTIQCFFSCQLGQGRHEIGRCVGSNTSSNWSDWSNCSHSCFTGIQTSFRVHYITMYLNGETRNVSTTRQKFCNHKPCDNATTIAWRHDGSLTKCFFNTTDVTSQFGSCLLKNGSYECFLDRYGNEMGVCEPVNGNYTQWSKWSNCSHSCFTGKQIRNRTCVNFKYGGYCTDPVRTEVRLCGQNSCFDLSNCTNATLSNGTKTCCMFGIALFNGTKFDQCTKEDDGRFSCPVGRAGNRGNCDPVDGKWSSWSNWTECTKVDTCSNTVRIQNRTCTEPLYGGASCPGPAKNETGCQMENCPPDASWTSWKPDKPCSVTCGTGKEVWKRDCLHNNGKIVAASDCPGMEKSTNSCKRIDCPGFFLGDFGQACSNACRNRSLACRWLDQPTPNNYFDEFGKLNVSCSPASTDFGEWKEDWHPAYVSEKCIGFKDVKYSKCSDEKPLSSATRRLCRCIYPGDIKYSEWSAWSVCSAYCGDAYKTRSRTCTTAKISECNETLSQNFTCDLQTCPDDEGFSSWSSWSSCSAECNGGLAYQYRTCNDKLLCFGHSNKSKLCNTIPCQVNGNWAEWSDWSVCSKSCDHGYRQRTRSCTNPVPRYGGSNCTGNSTEFLNCNTFKCSGYYLSMQDGNCNTTCTNIGFLCWPQIETKNTTDIFTSAKCVCSSDESKSKWKNAYDPSYDISTQRCMGYKEVPSNLACTLPLPLPNHVARLCNCQNKSNIGYTSWSIWGECSTSCGMGSRTRYRSCQTSPCSGTVLDTGSCDNDACPVDGGWTDFTVWSPCSKTCGRGKKRRYRYCANPVPRGGGLACDGDSFEEEGCNFDICPVHGMWSSWGDWTLCDKPCNNGTLRRERYCNNPKPQHDGRYCIGQANMNKSCNSHPCKAVSVEIFARFSGETFTEELANSSSAAFKKLESKIRQNVVALYQATYKRSRVAAVEVQSFRNGSVFSNFTVNFTEISKFELVVLMTSVQEQRLLFSMPVSFFEMKTSAVPTSPHSIFATAINETCIEVKWSNFTSTLTGFNVTAFSVTYRKTRSNNWQSVIVAPSKNRAYLKRLDPFTLYTLRVTALTFNSMGMPSNLYDVETMQGVPDEPPSNVSCRAESPTAIICEWGDIPTKSQNGNIEKYLIKYRKYSDSGNLLISKTIPWLNVSVSPILNTATISGLDDFTRYELQIHGVTKAGQGAGKWVTVETEENVPSSAPSNIKVKSHFSNTFVDVSWDGIPADKWNGRPVAIILTYTVTRKGSTTVVGGPEVTVSLKQDNRFHRIKGLKTNWEITVTMQGKTAAGTGIASQPVVAETCRCNKKLYTAWYKNNPYFFEQGGVVKGIFPDLLTSMVSEICGTCAEFGNTTIFYDRTKQGHSSKRASEADLKETISDNIHFNAPAGGKKAQTLFQGQYQYINIIDGVSSAFVVVDESKVSKTAVMFKSLASVWPLLVISILMMIIAGILLWMVDQFENPEEMVIGRFFAGSFRGFWWAFVSMTTVGYGDISPRGTLGRIIGIAWTLVGLIVNGILVSTMSTALTVITVKQQTMLYGAKVSAVYNSSEYILGIRGNANMTSTGKRYFTSKEVINALIKREVQGALLELNEAANLQTMITDNQLMIVKQIKSTSGIGLILSAEMANFDSQIRTYISNNNEYIKALIKKYTKTVETPAIKSRNKLVTGLFSSKSTTFVTLLNNTLYVLAGCVLLGIIWSYVIRIYLKRRARVHPTLSPEQLLQAHYKKWSKEIVNYGTEFMTDLQENIENKQARHGSERFKLLLKHFENQPFGASAWLKYKSFDHKRIISKMRIEEAFLENLHKKKKRRAKSMKLIDVTEEDCAATQPEYKM